EDLQRFLTGRPVLARPAGPVERLLCWRRKNRFTAATLIALAATLLSVVVATSAAAVRFETLADESDRDRRAADERRQAAVLATDEARRRGDAERWERY